MSPDVGSGTSKSVGDLAMHFTSINGTLASPALA